MQQLTDLAKELTEKYFKCNMVVGKRVTHPDGRTVEITSGCHRDPTYNRISNWWTWKEVLPDDSLGEEESGYGW